MKFLALLVIFGFCESRHFSRTFSRSVSGKGHFALNRIPEEGEVVQTEVGPMRLLQRLGKGSYGQVFRAEWGNRLVAFKIEMPGASNGCITDWRAVPDKYLQIQHEWRMMLRMNGTVGFPLVFVANFEGKFKYYVMQMLEKSLSAVKKSFPDQRIPTRALIQLAGQMLQRVESLHQKGILMYDIHLGNFMVDKDLVYVIDLGMAIPYRSSDGRHLPPGKSPVSIKCKQKMYATRNDVSGNSVSRRDDLERLVYVLVDLNVRSLPWKNLERWEDIIMAKRQATPQSVCIGKAFWLGPSLDHAYSLDFAQDPNYRFMIDSFYARIAEMDRLKR